MLLVTRPLSDVRDDNRGAVMLTGLFMSCFLIGALWFIVGIGDTLVFRDRMQEATDHGAYTAAALNAKGMNFISLCNLVLLAAATIHIILGIVHDIALALCIVSLGTTCGFWVGIRDIYTGYFEVLKPAARAIHNASKVGSYGFPVMGLAETLNVGKSYVGKGGTKPLVVPLSPSLLSGASFASISPAASKKEGLTLESRPMSLVCRRIASLTLDKLFNIALGAAGRSFGGRVLDLAKTIIGDVVENRYCNDLSGKARLSARDRVEDFIEQGRDAMRGGKLVRVITGNTAGLGGGTGGSTSGTGTGTGMGTGTGRSGIDPGFDSFWGEDGPMVVIGPAKNGNDWFQSYSVSLNPEMADVSESRVGISLGPKKLVAKYEKKVRPVGGFYLAQAEYFFDCDKKWSTEGCNFEGNSTFAIRWRARLRRFSIPSFSGLLGAAGSQLLTQVPQYDQWKRLSGQLDVGKDLFGGNGILGMTKLRGFLDEAGKQAGQSLKNELADQVKGSIPLDVPFH